MKKRIIASLLTASMLAAALAGCGGSTAQTADTSADAAGEAESAQGDPATVTEKETNVSATADADLSGTTITFWHSMSGVNGEALTALVDRFNEENTYGITVDAEFEGEYDDAINKLKSSMVGGSGPDLIQVYEIGTRFMIDSGWVIPMQELMDANGYDNSNIVPNIAAYYTIDDQLYSMPFNTSTPILYYNKDMFDAAGITEVPTRLEGIDAIADDLVNKGGAGEALSMGIYGWFFEQFICKQGLAYANNDNGRSAAATAVDFDGNGAALSIVSAWKDLYDKGYAPNVGVGGDAGLTDFSAGKAAITLGSTASLKQILNDVNGSFEVGTAYFPGIKDTDQGGVSIGGASLWAIQNQDDVKAQATWKFVEYLVSAESQAYWATQTGYFPVTNDAYNEDVFKQNIEQYPQFQTAIDQLNDTKGEYAGALLSVFPEARQTVQTEIENTLNDKETPEEAVQKMADTINASIEDYNLLNE